MNFKANEKTSLALPPGNFKAESTPPKSRLIGIMQMSGHYRFGIRKFHRFARIFIRENWRHLRNDNALSVKGMIPRFKVSHPCPA
jgi:hypothetical protein